MIGIVCENSGIAQTLLSAFDVLAFDIFFRKDDWDWILKFDIVVFQPRNADKFPFDVTTFGFPTWCYYYNNEPYLKVLIHVDFMHLPDEKLPNRDYYVHFVDPEDKCKRYRPTVLNETNFLNFNLFANAKSPKYAYYFIKKDNYICSYAFVYDILFNSFYSNVLEIKPANFYLIKNYPTENYAPNFFCVDVLYGTFVSLYWNRQSPPEAHYYIINEKDFTNIKLIDKMVLNEFDENILKDIFDNKIDESFYPTFTSYGRQIFISFKLVSDKKFAFNGFWKSESEYEVHFQDFEIGVVPLKNNYYRKLFRAKKSWIQYDRPVGRESAESTPPPLPQPQPLTEAPPPAPSTTKLSTTAPPPTTQPSTSPKTTTAPPPPTSSSKTTTVSATKTFQFKSSSIIDSSTAPSTSSPTTTTTSNNSNATNKGTNSILPTPQAQNSGTTTTSSSNEFSCFIYENPWILYLIIAIDICEIIIIILLIVFKFRGAKKMKEAMAKKNIQKSTKKNKKKPSSEAMPIKKSSKKKKQKNSKEYYNIG
uniref:Uncharacterized protein n=1 Tax=Panagrolaimus davidi TaxID=227884 RepID=A0A914QT71_9BILA